MQKLIELQELKKLIGESSELLLVEALPLKYFEQGHLPLAINIPLEAEDSVIISKLTNLQAMIVSYCTGKSCPNSARLASRLSQLGYTNVFIFEGGKEDWINTGNQLTKEEK